VASSTGFPVPQSTSPAIDFTIQIDAEWMIVTSVTGTTWSVIRGQDGSGAAAHANGAAVNMSTTLLQGPSGCNGIQATLHNNGSDTIFQASQGLSDLYNGSFGCQVDQTKNSPLLNTGDFKGCNPVQDYSAPGTSQKENFDHDVVATDFPNGSGAGLNEVCHQGVGHPPTDIARTSRDLITGTGADCNGLTFNGFALDGVVPLTWRNIPVSSSQGSPAAGCLVGQVQGSCTGVAVTNVTTSQLQDIYLHCTTPDPGPGHGAGNRLVDWRQLTIAGFTLPNPYDPTFVDGVTPSNSSEPIIVWSAQSNSGTRNSWQRLVLAGGASDTCVGDKNKNPSAGGTDALGNVTFENNATNFAGNTGFIPWCPAAGDATYVCHSPTNPTISVPAETFVPLTTLPATDGILSQSIWYFSGGKFTVDKQGRQQASPPKLNNVLYTPNNLLSNTYTTTRVLWYAVPTTDQFNPVGVAALPGGSVNCSSGVSADCSLKSNLQPGTQTFINWVCGGSNSGINTFDGNTYFFDQTAAIQAAGFTRIPSGSVYTDPNGTGRNNAGTSCVYEYTGVGGP
jgi:ABC-type phosphate transport system substrate-binding protein